MPAPLLDTGPGRHDWPTDALPIVFRSPPASYVVVKPEHLAEWEQLTAEFVGLRAKKAATFASWMETVCFCGEKPDGDPNPCDSDVLTSSVTA